MDVITYLCWDSIQTMLVKGTTGGKSFWVRNSYYGEGSFYGCFMQAIKHEPEM